MSHLSSIILEDARIVAGLRPMKIDRVDFRKSMCSYEDPEAELPKASDTFCSTFFRACGFAGATARLYCK